MLNKTKQQAYYFGFFAEIIASICLRIKFYSILARRHKTPFGEIDLIVTKGKQLVFIEIKARKDISVMDFISLRQQQRIIKAAEFFCMCNPQYKNHHVRFDAIMINRFYWLKHLKNYW